MKDLRKLTYSAMLLAIAMISMVVKGAGSVFVIFITGAIVNACIIIDTYLCGLIWGVILSIITPVAAYFISPNPVHQTIPIVVPCIMAGNAILAAAVALLGKKDGMGRLNGFMLPLSMLTGSVAKSAFMGIVISLIILPNMLPEAMMGKLAALQFSFSLVQLFAALVGSVYAFIVLKIVGRRAENL
ncbi:MAG: ECF transporter S component [Lachnospiraceae bacterium]|nr:ECF transporter S component [Lachnospiraceae bacterium]